MRRLILILIAIASVALVAEADNLKSTRNIKRNSPTRHAPVEAIVQVDTIVATPNQFRLSGYDKPLRSTSETVFVTNNSDIDIIGLELTTEYYDMQGRMLHKQTRRIAIDLPAGETRKVDYPTWDRQQAFYFHTSKRGRSAGTPYNVRQSVARIFALHSATSINKHTKPSQPISGTDTEKSASAESVGK